jgi:hypothetical protein
MDDLDTVLRSADPAPLLRRDEVRSIIDAMTKEIREVQSHRNRWWSRWRLTIPVGSAALLAITGAALAPQLFIWINGQEATLDTRIPITYTTRSGVSVECVFGAAVDPDKGGSLGDQERMTAFLNDNDWTGVGQEIYDYAIANPLTADDGSWTDDPKARDRQTLKTAIRQVILMHVPADLLDGTNVYLASTDNCEGQLK